MRISSASIGDVRRLAAHAAQRLVQQEAGVRQAEAVLALGAEEDVRAGAGHPAGADHLHARADEADHVVDRVAGFHMAAGRIDDHADVAVAFGGEASSWAVTRSAIFMSTSPKISTVRDLNSALAIRQDCGSGVWFSSSFSSFVFEAAQGVTPGIRGIGSIWADT